MPVSKIDLDKCIGCGTCVESCPMDVFRLDTQAEYRNEQSPCHLACPLGLRQREYHDLVEMGALEEAARLMWSCHPLPAITGRLCPHPCESECTRAGIDEAVNINALEQYLGDLLLTMDPATLRPEAAPVGATGPAAAVTPAAADGNGGWVAIIGSGPAGLSTAYFLTLDGFKVTVFEKADRPGGILRSAVPAFRLPVEVLDAQIDFYRSMGIEFRTGVQVGVDVTVNDLRSQGFSAVVATTGAARPLGLSLPRGGAEGVVSAMEFLQAAKGATLQAAPQAVADPRDPATRLHGQVALESRNPEPGDTRPFGAVGISGSVAVIGGGSVALDAARSALRLGAERVSVVCLECLEPGTKDSMPALQAEIEEAIAEGVVIKPSRGVESFVVADGRVSTVRCVECLSVRDSDGQFNPVYGEWILPEVIEAETVILAIGQTANPDLVPSGFVTDPRGYISVDDSGVQVPGLFACGDGVSGASTVVEAAAAGKKVASVVARYLRGEAREEAAEPAQRAAEPPTEKVETVARVERSLRPAAERRRSFAEVQMPLDQREARMEAGRCLTCGSRSKISYLDDCQVCRLCEHYCPTDAIEITDGALCGSMHCWNAVELGREARRTP